MSRTSSTQEQAAAIQAEKDKQAAEALADLAGGFVPAPKPASILKTPRPPKLVTGRPSKPKHRPAKLKLPKQKKR